MKVRVVARGELGRARGVIVALSALVVSLGAGSGLFALAGAPVGGALWVLVSEPFGSLYGFSETLVTATPLILCGLAVALAYRVGLWNIGAEGQLQMGAFAATGMALSVSLPAGVDALGVPLMVLAGALLGALWALLAGILRTHAQVSEILATLMLNYVAVAWVGFWIYGPWKGEDGFPYTAYIDDSWQLSTFLHRAHIGLFFAAGLAVLLWLVLRYTAFGYELRVLGASPATAHYAGMPTRARRLAVMAMAGGLAGVAGAFEVSGVAHRLQESISPGYGYSGIIVAFLARSQPLAVIFSGLFLAALAVGGEGLEIAFPSLSSATVSAFEGLLLLGVLLGQGLSRYRLVFVASSDKGSNVVRSGDPDDDGDDDDSGSETDRVVDRGDEARQS